MNAKWQTYTGWVLTVLAVLFLAMDAGFKLIQFPDAVTTTGELGFSASATQGLGVVLAVATILYAIPKSSLFGAVLLTGYLGGAVAIQLQHGSPLFSHVLFGVYVGVVVWLGLWLRKAALRALTPIEM